MRRLRPRIAWIAWLWVSVCDADLTIASWGGAYESAQTSAIFTPFSKASGQALNIVKYQGESDWYDAQAVRQNWDVIDMTEDQAIQSCKAGELIELDHAQLLDRSDESDFIDGAFRKCSVAQNLHATVIAFSESAFPGIKPTHVEDFFDLEQFPGKRGVRNSPDAILEWALMAQGVPTGQVYDLLSSDRGMRLAFQKLDSIRDHIVWWDDVDEPARLLRTGAVTMTSGYNGRLFSNNQEQNGSATILWDGRIVAFEVWAIPRSATDVSAALEFIRFALRPESQAALAEHIPYGPTRLSALRRIGLHPNTKIPMREHLPNSLRHSGRALHSDSLWYANTRSFRERRFRAWRSES